MRYIEAPTPLDDIQRPAVFLAGGITNCEDWQTPVAKTLFEDNKGKRGTIINPRRAEFPIDDPSAAEEQILWEHRALWMSDVVSIWFAGGESVQPIVMFEFGCHMGRFCVGGGPHRITIGVDPGYKRKQDVELQIKAHSISLRGSYRIVPVYTLEEHISRIQSALNSLR